LIDSVYRNLQSFYADCAMEQCFSNSVISMLAPICAAQQSLVHTARHTPLGKLALFAYTFCALSSTVLQASAKQPPTVKQPSGKHYRPFSTEIPLQILGLSRQC